MMVPCTHCAIHPLNNFQDAISFTWSKSNESLGMVGAEHFTHDRYPATTYISTTFILMRGAHPTFKKTVLNSWYSTCKFYLVIHFSTPRSIFMTEHCYVHGITIFYLKVFCFQWNSVLQHFFLLPLKGKSVQSYQCLNVLIVCDQQREINRLFSNHDLLSRAFGRKIGSLHFLCFQIFTMIFSEGDHITLDKLFVY